MTAIKPRILLWDIETSLMDVRTFQLYKDVTNHNMIMKDWHIICICYKWLGENKVHNIAKVGLDDDSQLVAKMAEVLSQADIVIHHNGDKFDVKKFNSRLIYHNLPSLPTLVTVDTLKAVKKISTFSSHRLDYLAKHLGLGGKLDTGSYLWHKATDGDTKAIASMVKYCKQDVKLLESLYLRIRPYIVNHPNINTIIGSDVNCPSCGSHNVGKQGVRRTRTGVYPRYKCHDCGSWSQGKKNLHTSINLR